MSISNHIEVVVQQAQNSIKMIDQICEKAKQDPSQTQFYELSLKKEMDTLRSCHENFKNWKNSSNLNQNEKAIITKSKRAIEKKINELKNGTKRSNTSTNNIGNNKTESTNNIENNNTNINPNQPPIQQPPIQTNDVEQQQVVELAKQYLSSGYMHLREHMILIQQEIETLSRNEQEKNRMEHLRERLQLYGKYMQELELISHNVNDITIQTIEELRSKIQFYVDQTRKDELRIKYQGYYNNPYQQNLNQPNTKTPPSLIEIASNTKENEQMIAILQKQKAFTYAMLESSLINLPKYEDLESENKFTNITPVNQVETPSYYPKTVLSSFDNPNLFSRMDTDTLFYIFYYQQNTNQQLLAAKELKKKNWFYHTQYLTWFQPLGTQFDKNLPFNKGTFIFFDYENGWCQRKKEDFTFETCYLEDSAI